MKKPNLENSFVYFRHSSVAGVKWRALTAVGYQTDRVNQRQRGDDIQGAKKDIKLEKTH